MMKLGLYLQYYSVDFNKFHYKQTEHCERHLFHMYQSCMVLLSPAALRTVMLCVDFKVCATFGPAPTPQIKQGKKKKEIITVSSV